MCFVCGRTRLCQLTTNWNCASFCAAILEDMWPEVGKAIQSKEGSSTLFPFSESLCFLIALKGLGLKKRVIKDSYTPVFLNVEVFIHEESQYHNI